METMESRARRGFNLRGFTLIELLIAIAIVVLLVSILFPVFSRTREKARSTLCAGNLRQIGMALTMYINDNNNYHPPAVDVTQYCTWIEGVKPYARNTKIFECPSARYGKYVEGCPAPIIEADRKEHFNGSYLLNIFIDSHSPIKASRLTEPSTSIFVTEGESGHTQLFFGAQVDMENEIRNNGIFQFRHNQGSNNLFVDGHVKWLSRQALSDIQLWIRK